MTQAKKRRYLPAVCFVQVWQAYRSLDEVLEVTRFDRLYAIRRARDYRGRGIPLKRHKEEAPLSNNALNVRKLTREAVEWSR